MIEVRMLELWVSGGEDTVATRQWFRETRAMTHLGLAFDEETETRLFEAKHPIKTTRGDAWFWAEETTKPKPRSQESHRGLWMED